MNILHSNTKNSAATTVLTAPPLPSNSASLAHSLSPAADSRKCYLPYSFFPKSLLTSFFSVGCSSKTNGLPLFLIQRWSDDKSSRLLRLFSVFLCSCLLFLFTKRPAPMCLTAATTLFSSFVYLGGYFFFMQPYIAPRHGILIWFSKIADVHSCYSQWFRVMLLFHLLMIWCFGF